MTSNQHDNRSPAGQETGKTQSGPTALLAVIDLTTEIHTPQGKILANNKVSLSVQKGKTLGIVGESGSGKSMFCRSILRLIPPPHQIAGGEVWFDGQNLLKLSEKEMRKMRGNDIGMIFQDPMTSLNPVWRIGNQVAEGLMLHRALNSREARSSVIDMLQRVGIPSPEKRVDEYPHRLSGGMRQRVMIAMAIALKPKLLLADEPTTALDVTIQDQILSLMLELQEQNEMSVILVSHNMGIVAEMSQELAVMYAGQIMEVGTTEATFLNPRHPYTLGLLQSIPRFEGKTDRLTPIQGQPPNLLNLPKGCPFADRCRFVSSECLETPVRLHEVESGHSTACLFPERIKA
jgi:oligopeptide/dipeptide ABC transporter ATP-binding protein